MSAIQLKEVYGAAAFYAACKDAFTSGHTVTSMQAATNYARLILVEP